MKFNLRLIFYLLSFILLILLAYSYFIPTRFKNKCNDKNIYKFKLGVYKIDSTITKEIEYEKIGGILEFLNIKKVKCIVDIEEEYYLKIKHSRDSITKSLNWKKLNCGLYKNKNGDIGFKDYRVIGMEGLITEEYYITKVGFNDGEQLNKIVDTTTFKELGNTYYKDKNHIYHFYGMAGGGSFYIFDEADYETFEILGDCYAKDKNNIYEMRSGKIDSIDYKTFKTIVGPGCYAKDKNGYYSWGTKIEKEYLNDKDVKEAIRKLNE